MVPLWKPSARAADPFDDRLGLALLATPEAAILAGGIYDQESLATAMSQPDKSPALICLILEALDDLVGLGVIADCATQMTTLLAEPALGAQALRRLAELARENGAPDVLLTAICAHARTEVATVIETLWNAPVSTARDVGLATGTLLSAATKWVRAGNPSARWDAASDQSLYWSYVSVAQRAQICALAQEWTTATAGDPDLRSFLITASFAFTDEHEMFAAGRAVTAAPTGPSA